MGNSVSPCRRRAAPRVALPQHGSASPRVGDRVLIQPQHGLNGGVASHDGGHCHNTVRRVELLRMMEGNSYVQRFPRRLEATIVKVQPDSKLEGVSLMDLKFDGLSGKHFTVIMIDRANFGLQPTKWKVMWTEDMRSSLRFLTPTRWSVTANGKTRLKGTPIDPEHPEEMDVPVGATVDASAVDNAKPGQELIFTCSRYDLFPQASTSLEQGQFICYGCPAICHLALPSLTAAGAKWVQQHTDASGRLTCRKKFRRSSPEGESESDADEDFVEQVDEIHCQHHPENELLEGFQRVLLIPSQPDWQGTMPRNPPPAEAGMEVTYQFQPKKLIDHKMQTKFRVPANDMRTGYFDLDYFEYNGKISGEELSSSQPLTLGVLNFRWGTGITVVGVAKLRAQEQDIDTTYDIEWFPGPEMVVKEGDLFIIMRAPSDVPYGPSQGIVREEDVMRFAKVITKPQDVCAVCLEAPPNIRIMPCSHKVLCSDCCAGMQRRACPVCRGNVGIFVLEGQS